MIKNITADNQNILDLQSVARKSTPLDELGASAPRKTELNLGIIIMIDKWKSEILMSDGLSDEDRQEW